MLEDELAPFQTSSKHVTTNGPSISLKPPAAQALALALHELATNAAKYGALASSSGRLNVTWSVLRDDIVVHWSETGADVKSPPHVEGFGTKVIKSGVEQQLGGKVLFDWRNDGLRCELRIPHANGAAEQTSAIEATVAKASGQVLQKTAGRPTRVLLVEDETLVAMMMEDLLADLGAEVVGPFNTLAEAMIAAREDNFDTAILDVNLDGRPVYPLALLLAERDVPFAFVTGYEPSTIDARFRGVPVLQKPVERESLSELLAHVGPHRDPRSPSIPRPAAAYNLRQSAG